MPRNVIMAVRRPGPRPEVPKGLDHYVQALKLLVQRTTLWMVLVQDVLLEHPAVFVVSIPAGANRVRGTLAT